METTTRRTELPNRPQPTQMEEIAGSIAETLAAVEIIHERAKAGSLADVTASLSLLREAVAELAADAKRYAEVA